MATYTVPSGGTSYVSGLQVNANESVEVLSGGTTIIGNATVTLKESADIAKFVNGESEKCMLALAGFTGTQGGVSGFGTVTVSGATAVGG